ncbi:MAG: FIST C-terminal domain-containing protein [Ignavibacteriaceae bacterium]|nr:FIST C-terminal domain-containing protein [Ignavibacteriaceae bacterium]
MKAKSIKGKSSDEIKNALAESMADGFKPTLAVVFLSVKQDQNAVCKILDDQGISIFGSTTSGEFIDGDYTEGAIAILLLEVDQTYFKIIFEEYVDKDPRLLVKHFGEKALRFFSNPTFILVSSGFFLDGEQLIRGIEDAAGIGANIWGGRAGDDRMGKTTFVFTNNKSSEQGIAILLIDGNKITVKGQALAGWKGVGTPKTITKSDGLWIQTLDDQPALDMMIKYMGYKFEGMGDSSPQYDSEVTSPVMLLREKGEPVLRSQSFINWSDRSIMLSGNFEPNAKIQLTLPPDFDIVDDVVKSCQQLKETELPEADAIIMFSCSGRLVELGPMIGKEIDGIKNTFGVPMAGFFTYGEYGRATDGNNEYHNYTCCWVALKEKQESE